MSPRVPEGLTAKKVETLPLTMAKGASLGYNFTRGVRLPTWTASRPILVGLCPPPDATPGERLIDGQAAARLLSFAGLAIPAWLSPVGCTPGEVVEAHFDVESLWPVYTRPRGAAENRARANSMPIAGRTVILLGREVQDAFAHLVNGPLDFYGWQEARAGGGVFGLVPHPSPLNRMHNYVEHRRMTGQVLRRALEVAA